MNKKTTWVIIILAIIIVAAVTNPKAEDHKLAVKEKLNQYLTNEMQENDEENENDEWAATGNSLGMLLGSSLVEKFIDGAITSENYVIFSLTKATFKGETKIIGFGIFGNVFLSKKVDEALKKD